MIVSAGRALFTLDLWHGVDHAAAAAALGFALPGPGRAESGPAGTVLRLGPRRWWLDGHFGDIAIAPELGVLTAIGGGWTKVDLRGSNWRDLVMDSGLIDAENTAFGAGTTAVTLLHHVRCALHVHSDDHCTVFVPSSYAEHCLSAWRASGWQAITQ